jgi:hypothetical protein
MYSTHSYMYKSWDNVSPVTKPIPSGGNGSGAWCGIPVVSAFLAEGTVPVPALVHL